MTRSWYLGEPNTNTGMLTERRSDSLLGVEFQQGESTAGKNLATPRKRRQIVMQCPGLASSSRRLITFPCTSNRICVGGDGGCRKGQRTRGRRHRWGALYGTVAVTPELGDRVHVTQPMPGHGSLCRTLEHKAGKVKRRTTALKRGRTNVIWECVQVFWEFIGWSNNLSLRAYK